MRFFRRQEPKEAPCPRCCIPVDMSATECPHCGLDLREPNTPQGGWTTPVEKRESVGGSH